MIGFQCNGISLRNDSTDSFNFVEARFSREERFLKGTISKLSPSAELRNGAPRWSVSNVPRKRYPTALISLYGISRRPLNRGARPFCCEPVLSTDCFSISDLTLRNVRARDCYAIAHLRPRRFVANTKRIFAHSKLTNSFLYAESAPLPRAVKISFRDNNWN